MGFKSWILEANGKKFVNTVDITVFPVTTVIVDDDLIIESVNKQFNAVIIKETIGDKIRSKTAYHYYTIGIIDNKAEEYKFALESELTKAIKVELKHQDKTDELTKFDTISWFDVTVI